MKKINTFDVVVIGSGPGGTTAAKILSENPNLNIAIIEEGESNNSDIPMGTHKDLTKRYRYGGAEIIFSNPNISIAEGRGLGGGSEVNSGIYHRIPESTISEWNSKYKIDNLNKSSLKESYEFIEDWLKIDNVIETDFGISNLIVSGAKNLDLEYENCKTWNVNQSSTKKNTMTEVFYNNCPKNVKVFKNTKAKKINFDKAGRAYEIVCESNEVQKFIIQFDKLILSCGTFQSPFLLKLSRYSFINKLSFNIHPHLKIGALIPTTKTNNEIVSNYQIKLKDLNSSIGSSINSDSWKALFLADNWKFYSQNKVSDELMNLFIFYTMIKPKGIGRILFSKFLKSYTLTYKFSRNDFINLAKSSEIVTKMLFSLGASNVLIPNTSFKFMQNIDDFEVGNFLNQTSNLNIHSVHTFSSTRIGELNNSECNSFGILKNCKNIMVADSSILPSPPGVNPQGPLMSLVHRNINNWKE